METNKVCFIRCRKREGDYYFLELKPEYLNKYIIEDIKQYVNNPVSKKYIIFHL